MHVFSGDQFVRVTFLAIYAIARPSVVCLSVTVVRPTQAVQIFGNISTALGTFVIRFDIH